MENRRTSIKHSPFYKRLKKLYVGVFFAALVTLFGLLIYTYFNPEVSAPVYITLININVILAVLAGLYIGRSLMLLFLDRRGRLKGARLHIRLLGIFSILAILPAILIGILSFYLMNKGIDTWFSNRVSLALEGSLQVAEAYLDEHEGRLLAEVKNIARAPQLHGSTTLLDTSNLRDFLQQEQIRGTLDSLTLYDNRGTVIAAAGVSDGMSLSSEILFNINNSIGQRPETFRNLEARRLLAVARINSELSLVAERWIHPSVLARVDETQAAWREYSTLQKEKGRFRFLANVMAALVGLICMVGAVWTGLRLASNIVKPVTELVHATNRVSAGDLDVRLQPKDSDEIGILTQSFNRMTQQIKSGRELLERKNNELDDRRRMMEAVLTGVFAGVISVDEHTMVKTANKTAGEMLGIKVGQPLARGSQELAIRLKEFLTAPLPMWEDNVRLTRPDGESRLFLVRFVPQREVDGDVHSVVVSFDDITPLISAQKNAAWGEVAQRLAHEIKNPLTPIQLSAERLRRKYLKNIPEDADKELFAQLTETIVRQTEDMRTMLNEFSAFARMPAPKMASEDIKELIKEAQVLQSAHVDITTKFEDDTDLTLRCDRSHVLRVLRNLLENAINAIAEHNEAAQEEGNKQIAGKIKIVVKRSQGDTLLIVIQDNGPGLPREQDLEALFNPYVTTRAKGTGLGLAIVKRVMDEHGGQVKLKRRKGGGTEAELMFPLPVTTL